MSVSDPDSVKILVFFRSHFFGFIRIFFLGASSVLGGGVSGRVDLGILILPFGFFFPLTRAPFIGGFLVGAEGA